MTRNNVDIQSIINSRLQGRALINRGDLKKLSKDKYNLGGHDKLT